MGTHNLHFYNPHIGGLKPSCFMVFGVQGYLYNLFWTCDDNILPSMGTYTYPIPAGHFWESMIFRLKPVHSVGYVFTNMLSQLGCARKLVNG